MFCLDTVSGSSFTLSKENSFVFFSANTPLIMSMEIAITPPTSATLVVPDAVDDSSDEEEQNYTLDEAILDWYVGKRPFTVASYAGRVRIFRQWYRDNYGREISVRLKVKHVRLFFLSKSNRCRQMRQLVTVIKGLLKHLFKCKVLKKDLSLSFKTEKQLPAKVERVMTGEQVKLFFVEANKHKDASTMHMLQCLAYGGLRRGACSELMCTDIKKKDYQKNGEVISNYFIFVRDGKGGKQRTIPIKKSIGRSLYTYATSLKTTYLFPGSKENTHIGARQIAHRVKSMARRIGCPAVSCHFFVSSFYQHLYRSPSLTNLLHVRLSSLYDSVISTQRLV